jgi:hypothetical protein
LYEKMNMSLKIDCIGCEGQMMIRNLMNEQTIKQ